MSSNVCQQIISRYRGLGSSSWVIAYRVPRNDKAKLHRLEAEPTGQASLLFIAGLRHRLNPPDDASTLVVSCFEAGQDGFWLHRPDRARRDQPRCRADEHLGHPGRPPR